METIKFISILLTNLMIMLPCFVKAICYKIKQLSYQTKEDDHNEIINYYYNYY